MKANPHIIDGEFQSDKYPTCPRGKVPLSTKDKSAQDLLWIYAQRRREVDVEFSEAVEEVLKKHGFVPSTGVRPPLEDWAKLAEAATEGPWRWDPARAQVVCVDYGCHTDEPDSRFIAASRTAVPVLIAYAISLEARVAELNVRPVSDGLPGEIDLVTDGHSHHYVPTSAFLDERQQREAAELTARNWELAYDKAVRERDEMVRRMTGEVMRRRCAYAMSDEEIAVELASLGTQWDESRAADDEGHGGSPGEWMVERMGELETEQKRRRAASKEKP